MKRCIIIRPEWRIIEGWAPAYAVAFESLGYEVSLVDTICDVLNILSSSINSDSTDTFDFLLTFSGYGIDAAANNGLHLDTLGLPVIALYVDHPENTALRFNLSPVNSFSGLFDRADIVHARKYLNSPTQYFFLTDAGLEYPKPPPGFDERDIDIMFCGTIPDYQENRTSIKNMNRPNLLKLFDELTHMLLENEHISPYDAFEVLISGLGLDFKPSGADGAMLHSMLSLATHYVRGKRRIALLNTLFDSGLKLTCVGKPEQFHIFDSLNFEVLDYEKYDTFGEGYLNLIRRSKVTINTSPLSQYALSERQPTSMLNGTLVVSDMNPYMEQYFKDGRDLIAYSHNDYSPLPERIRQVLDNRKKWEDMTQNAYTATKNYHTFLHRAKEILEVLNSGF